MGLPREAPYITVRRGGDATVPFTVWVIGSQLRGEPGMSRICYRIHSKVPGGTVGANVKSLVDDTKISN